MTIFVNCTEITDDEVHRELQYHPAPSVDQAAMLAKRALVIRELLRQEAKRSNLVNENIESLTPELEEELVEALITKHITIPEADINTCKRYYETYSTSFIDNKTKKVLPFNLVENYIRDYLHTKALRAAISEYIRQLSREATIKGFSME